MLNHEFPLQQRHLKANPRLLTGLLLLYCLSILLPHGYMPARDAQGRVTISLCTGNGPINIVVDADGQPSTALESPSQAESSAHSAHSPCPFAAANLATAQSAWHDALPMATSARLKPAALATATLPFNLLIPTSARAPPFSS